MGVAHFTFDFGFRRQRGDGVDDDDVDRARTDEHVGDLEGLLTGVRLRHEEIVHVDAELGRVERIERVLGIDEGGGAAEFLHLGHDVQRERGLARGFGAEDFDDAAARQAADAECEIEAQRAGRHDVDVALRVGVAHAHDGPAAELFLDLCERRS